MKDVLYQIAFPPMTWNQLGKVLEGLPKGMFPEIQRLVARDDPRPNGSAAPPRGELEDAILMALKSRALSHAELAAKTGRNPKSVYSALTRMKRKRMVTKKEGRYARV